MMSTMEPAMKSMKRKLGVPFGLLCLGLSVIIACQVGASRGATATPTTVVTIDLPMVFEGLDQRAALETDLAAMRESMRAEETRRQTELDEMQAQWEDIPETDLAARQRMNEEVTLKALEFNAWRAFASEQLDIEKSILLRDLDRNVQAAIKELSELNGYDLVINDDSGQPLAVDSQAKVPREIQVRQQMLARRLLYVNPSVDITDELVERMNNAFAAGP
jgi:Skp family chaperone for outer membrane proteins